MKKVNADLIDAQSGIYSNEIANESAMKSAGGVFLTLLKKRVSKDKIKQIFKVEALKQKEKKHVLRSMNSLMGGEPLLDNQKPIEPEAINKIEEDMKCSHKE